MEEEVDRYVCTPDPPELLLGGDARRRAGEDARALRCLLGTGSAPALPLGQARGGDIASSCTCDLCRLDVPPKLGGSLSILAEG